MFKEQEENVVKWRYGNDVSSEKEYQHRSSLKDQVDTWVRKYNNENNSIEDPNHGSDMAENRTG